ncbi:MAG: 5-(carboxyamino)imidazole ribonucleotide synthase [Pirellulales bacterium]
MNAPILPGGTIGLLGSGQLGRMLAMSARRFGYQVHVFSPEANSPAGQLADREIVADYADLDRVATFARQVDVVTFEFENVPRITTDAAEKHAPVRPGGGVLHAAQNRVREKRFLADAGLPTARFAVIKNAADLEQAMAKIGAPSILKTAAWGYDGKGQVRIDAIADAPRAWRELGEQPAVLEGFVSFSDELSIVAARDAAGNFTHFGPIHNTHVNHILDISVCPAGLPAAVTRRAEEIARVVMQQLDVVGVLCVELFLTGDGELIVNELAPRPHNSGHLTIDAHATCQFEQQLRAVCGLPLGSTRQRQPAAMTNLLGDLWQPTSPDWAALLAMPDVKLHLYGKQQPLPGRKMGHVTAVADSVAAARALAVAAREKLRRT